MKRYSVNVQYRTGQERMLETEGGQWVRHSDVATLAAENTALNRKVEGLELRLMGAERAGGEPARAEAFYKQAEALLTTGEKTLHEQIAALKGERNSIFELAVGACRVVQRGYDQQLGRPNSIGSAISDCIGEINALKADDTKAQLAAAEPFDAEAVQRIIMDYCSDKMMAEHCRAMGEEIIDLFRTAPPQHAADKPWIALAATMYQAAGAFDMPVRVLDLLSTAQCDMPFGHLIDGVLPVMPEQHAARVSDDTCAICGSVGEGACLRNGEIGDCIYRPIAAPTPPAQEG